jgi:hypothetical protein
MSPIAEMVRIFSEKPKGDLNESRIRMALSRQPLSISGTISAIYDAECAGHPVLIKVFSRNWSRHSRDFCEWAYDGKPLSLAKANEISQNVIPYVERLLTYGLEVVLPLEVWTIPDPFTTEETEWAVAQVVPKLPYPSVHQHLFTVRSDRKAFLSLLEENVVRVLAAVRAARNVGDLDGPVIHYGFDPKPRNFLQERGWWYVDSFPVLNPEVLDVYFHAAPRKAFWKRFDTRYYLFDVLMRYYRIRPDLLDDLRDTLFQQIRQNGIQTVDCIFINDAIEAYREKWGHLLPDKE